MVYYNPEFMVVSSTSRMEKSISIVVQASTTQKNASHDLLIEMSIFTMLRIIDELDVRDDEWKKSLFTKIQTEIGNYVTENQWQSLTYRLICSDEWQ